MNELTCKDCKHRKLQMLDDSIGYLTCDKTSATDPSKICADFELKSGKRPRFCRLASSVDEMATLIISFSPKYDKWLVKLPDSHSHFPDFYDTKEQATDAAKQWLMEVEE